MAPIYIVLYGLVVLVVELVRKKKNQSLNKKIEETVVGGYKKIEEGVVAGYKKIEDGVVSGYQKVEDKFVDKYLTKDGETVEEAKKRLSKQ